MSNNDKQNTFIESTVTKLQNELQKFIINTNYSNSYSLSVYQKLNTFKNKLASKHQTLSTEPNASPNVSSFLPQINQSNHPFHVHKPNAIYTLKHRNSNYRYQLQTTPNTLSSEATKDETTKSPRNVVSQSVSLNPYSINKYLKYSNENRNKHFYHDKIYSNLNYPLIRNKEMKQGLLHMIYQGYIPKHADLTPAFNQHGNPFCINNNSNNELTLRNYSKVINRGDLSLRNSCNVSNSNNNTKESGCVTNTKQHNKALTDISTLISQKYPTLFITETNSNNTSSGCNNDNNNNTISTSSRNAITLTYNNGNIIKNTKYNSFLKQHPSLKQSILYILTNISLLLKKLTFTTHINIDTSKLLHLLTTKPHLTKINNKDLLLCLTPSSLSKIGLDPNNMTPFIEKLRDIFAIKIQSKFRQYLSFKAFHQNLYNLKQIITIQSHIRKHLSTLKLSQLLIEHRNNKLIQYNSLLTSFKHDWPTLTEHPRIEIHINSYSYSNYMNTTISKYTDKQCLQLNRLIRLIDPNLEIVYVTTTDIDEDVLRYYTSILNSIGIDNIDKRLHIIIPETTRSFPPHYSLSQLLYFSTQTQNKIKRIIYNKPAYIIPGTVSVVERELSVLLDVPILMGDLSQTETLFNKSGCKTVFNANDIPYPISAWDITDEEEFYSSLANLISMYPHIRIWLFKINTEIHGRGIAYLHVSSIDAITQLLHSKQKHLNQLELKQQVYTLLTPLLLSQHIHIVNTHIYPTWNEYFKTYITNGGVIEACPTPELTDIIGNPTLPILIEPHGKVKVLPTYDKYNINHFNNILCVSPQKTLINVDMNSIGEKIGMYLYSKNIIGYATIEFIAFKVKNNVVQFWGIDMTFGLSDYITSLQFGYFLYIQSTIRKCNVLYSNDSDIDNDNDNEIEIDYAKIISDAIAFTIPTVISDDIGDVMFNELLRYFSYKNLVFDIDKREGIVFNFASNLQRGIIGMCGVVNLDRVDRAKGEGRLWENVEKGLEGLGMVVKKFRKGGGKKKEGRYVGEEDGKRKDGVELKEMYVKVKGMVRRREKGV